MWRARFYAFALSWIMLSRVPGAHTAQSRWRVLPSGIFRRWCGTVRDGRLSRQEIDCRPLRADRLAQRHRTRSARIAGDLDQTRFDDEVAFRIALGMEERGIRLRLACINFRLA